LATEADALDMGYTNPAVSNEVEREVQRVRQAAGYTIAEVC